MPPERAISPLRLAKYRLLSHVPGRIGLKYASKLRMRFLPEVQEAYRAALRGADGKICIDLGANLGEHTREMAGVAAKVYAFEPDPWSAEELRKRVADLDNVEVVEAAAGTEDGTIQIYRTADFDDAPEKRSLSTSTIADKLNVDESAALEVKQVDFARFLRDLDADVALIKIDIEGAEVALLESLLDDPALNRVGHIFVETHESRIPALAARTMSLRERVAGMTTPVINMDWK